MIQRETVAIHCALKKPTTTKFTSTAQEKIVTKMISKTQPTMLTVNLMPHQRTMLEVFHQRMKPTNLMSHVLS